MPKQQQARQITAPVIAARAAWSPTEWAAAFGFTVWWFHQLKDELAPRSVMLHGRRLVTESPTDYLARVAALQIADPRRGRRAKSPQTAPKA